jgi:hypothetical protein
MKLSSVPTHSVLKWANVLLRRCPSTPLCMKFNVKVKLFLHLIKHRSVKMYGGIKIYLFLHAFLISTLDICEWSVSHSGNFTPGEKACDTYWIEAYVRLDVVVPDKFNFLYRNYY